MLRCRATLLSSLTLIFCCTLLNSAEESFKREDFPPDFIFGAGSSAYQVEGAAFEDGRSATTADAYAHSGYFPDNADVSCDQYHKYKDDVQLMVETGLDAYRFSISWARLLPHGRGPVNPKGLEYYNNLINELVKHGIQPHVTLLHQDVPLVLEDEYGGFTNPRIVEDFTGYSDVCFREFGDRVLHWTSINEANLFAYTTYAEWRGAPRNCTSPVSYNCTIGNLKTVEFDPFLIAHHALLAHASAARLYRDKYLDKQQGFLVFSLYAFYFVPSSNSTADIMATQRSYNFFIDWMMHPLMYGDYSEIIKRAVKDGLPAFSKSDSQMLKGSFDFIGLNFYAAAMVKDNPSSLNSSKGFGDYMEAMWIFFNDSNPLDKDPFANTAWAMQGILEHFKNVYDNPRILIHENGQLTNYSTTNLNDPTRVEYISDHIGSLLQAVRNGSNVKGYFAWSFLDVFEFLYGYENTFGLYYVDFNDSNLTRSPKLSQKWYSGFLKGKNNVVIVKQQSQENVGDSLSQSVILQM